MTRRSIAQWHTLIEKFEQSGLTQSEFCADNGLNAKYFSFRRSQLTPQASAFVQAQKPSSPACHSVNISYGGAIVHLGNNPSPHFISQLVKSLI